MEVLGDKCDGCIEPRVGLARQRPPEWTSLQNGQASRMGKPPE